MTSPAFEVLTGCAVLGMLCTLAYCVASLIVRATRR